MCDNKKTATNNQWVTASPASCASCAHCDCESKDKKTSKVGNLDSVGCGCGCNHNEK